jgi:hypothetical protein
MVRLTIKITKKGKKPKFYDCFENVNAGDKSPKFIGYKGNPDSPDEEIAVWEMQH